MTESKTPIVKCELCGEPMPLGEEMFKYHGYSSDCPKPPFPVSTKLRITDHLFIEQRGGGVWLVCVEKVHASMEEAQAACRKWAAAYKEDK